MEEGIFWMRDVVLIIEISTVLGEKGMLRGGGFFAKGLLEADIVEVGK